MIVLRPRRPRKGWSPGSFASTVRHRGIISEIGVLSIVNLNIWRKMRQKIECDVQCYHNSAIDQSSFEVELRCSIYCKPPATVVPVPDATTLRGKSRRV